MKSIAPILSAAAMAAALISTPAAWSQDVLLPQEQTSGQVAYINGGADLDEAEAIKRMTGYPLRIVMAERSGSYGVAERLVVMRDGQTVAQISDAGPWLLMKLPTGRYTVEATFGGQTQRRNVTIGASGTTLHLLAPSSAS